MLASRAAGRDIKLVLGLVGIILEFSIAGGVFLLSHYQAAFRFLYVNINQS